MTCRHGFLVAAHRSIALAGCLLAASCAQLGLSTTTGGGRASGAGGFDSFVPGSTIDTSMPFYGSVVADEPTAALAAREIMRQGGSAADAAVAGLFVMGVTLPTSAGLGGGGACLTWHSDRHAADVVDFRPRPTAGGGMSVPMTIRGLAVLHAREGRLRWEQVVGPAERLARFGTPVSRALAIDLGEAGSLTRLDDAGRRLVSDEAEQPLKVGASMVQLDLATLLARVRTQGAGELYAGHDAAMLSEAAQAVGGDLTVEDLRGAVPAVVAPQVVPFGDFALIVPPAGAPGGGVAADLITRLTKGGYADMAPAARPALIASASRAAFEADAGRRGVATLPETATPPSASLVAVEPGGTVVACGVTQLGWFGSGHLMPGTGLFTAPPAPPGGVVEPVPMLVSARSGARLYLAAAAGGGPGAPVAGVITVLGSLVEGLPLPVVLERPRYYGAANAVMVEDPDSDSGHALAAGGVQLTRSGPIARVAGVVCPTGIPADKVSCSASADPRMGGLAAGY